MLELPSPLAVACHDAGGANIVFSWLAATAVDFRAVVKGPAARLWAERFPGAPTVASVGKAVEGAAALLSGTGWASDLEHEARRVARARGIWSVAVLDHWVNYRERFTRGCERVWPDEFWVTDTYAAEEARRCFPNAIVCLKPNTYLREQLARISATPAQPQQILYVLEPARSNWARAEAGEFQALDYFMEHRATVGAQLGSVRLRPHPSDAPDKYGAWLARYQGRAVLDDSAGLAEAISRCGWVAGTESFALVIALEAGRRVVCTLPPWAPACRLPHCGLLHLKDLVGR